MPTLSVQQVLLLAEAAEAMTKLREASRAMRTPGPAERISVIPGVADLVLRANPGLESVSYALDLAPQTPPEGVGESKSPG
jgi:hypothetical protein